MGKWRAGGYHGLVKQLFACATLMAVCSALGTAQSGNAAALAQVKTVYLLPMAHGMDQYLANRLTHSRVLQVVTDPAKADAVLTDHVGPAYEAAMKELYPQVKPAPPAKPDDEDQKADSSDSDKPAPPEPMEMKSIGAERPVVPARNRGTVFLVKRDTSEVLWSAYNDPSVRRAKDLNRVAGKFVGKLQSAIKHASPKAPAGTSPANAASSPQAPATAQ